MPYYYVKPKPASIEEWRTWVQMGYLGSYDQYVAAKRESNVGVIHISGDLGPHCTECAAPSENLCDYPVGEGKTCDRPLCDEHSKGVAGDTHYCRDHWIMWMDYLASERGYEVMNNVTPLGVVRDSDRSGEAVETTGSTEGESAGRDGIAQPLSALTDDEGGS